MPKPATLLLLFDVDGTLVRTGGAGMRAFNQGITDVFGWTDAIAFSPAGMTDTGIAQRVARERLGRDLTETELRTLFERYLANLDLELKESAEFKVTPGTRELLVILARDDSLMLGLGTGNLEAGARLKLERAGLNQFFPFGGYGSDSASRPELLRLGWRRAEERRGETLAPANVIIVGDTPLDIQAGLAIGLRTLAVATGPFSREQLLAAGAEWAVDNFLDPEPVLRLLAGLRACP